MEQKHPTIPALIFDLASRFEGRPAMRWYAGSWQQASWRQLFDRIKHLGMGLLNRGLKMGDRVALCGPNSPEWVIADLALTALGVVTVPLYRSLDTQTILALLKDSGATGIIADGGFVSEHGEAVVRFFKKKRKALLVSRWPSVDQEEMPAAWIDFSEIEAFGAAAKDYARFFANVEKLQPDAPFTIIYTSGTTGEPKGAIISHSNLLHNFVGTHHALPIRLACEVYLSFLPLAHAFERHCYYATMARGAEMVFSRGVEQLASDLVEVAPTVMIVVPRILERVHNKICATAVNRGILSRSLFRWAIGQGERAFLSKENRQPSGLARLFVLDRIKKKLGGRLHLLVCGGGALSPELVRFFNGAGVPLLEGYGLTETSPVVAVNHPDSNRPGTVGKVYCNLKATISTEGELLLKGPSVFSGYYKNEAATAEVFDHDGWLHTGDLAEIDDDGFLRITGRTKDLFVTSTGKNIAPQKIELQLAQLPWLDQVFLVGDGKPFIGALLVLQPTILRQLVFRKRGKAAADVPTTTRELLANDAVLCFLEEQIHALNETLPAHEAVKRFAVLPKAFSEKEGTLTPTLKIRRHKVLKSHADVVAALYNEPGANCPDDVVIRDTRLHLELIQGAVVCP